MNPTKLDLGIHFAAKKQSFESKPGTAGHDPIMRLQMTGLWAALPARLSALNQRRRDGGQCND
jgi:hypothetical protein